MRRHENGFEAGEGGTTSISRKTAYLRPGQTGGLRLPGTTTLPIVSRSCRKKVQILWSPTHTPLLDRKVSMASLRATGRGLRHLLQGRAKNLPDEANFLTEAQETRNFLRQRGRVVRIQGPHSLFDPSAHSQRVGGILTVVRWGDLYIVLLGWP